MVSLLISASRERAKYAPDEGVQTRKSAGTVYRKRAALVRNRDHRRLRSIPQALASLGSAVYRPSKALNAPVSTTVLTREVV